MGSTAQAGADVVGNVHVRDRFDWSLRVEESGPV
jgi:hypothetical protein